GKAKADIKDQLEVLEKQGLCCVERCQGRNSLTSSRVSPISLLVRKGPSFVQECVPEHLNIKRDVWSKVDPVVTSDVILSSSSSALLPSDISEGLTHKQRFLTNPPFYAPLVELCLRPWTDPDVVPTTRELLSSIGLVPVLVKKEVPGFVLNRLQYVLLGEAWKLIRDEVMTATDLDKVMSCMYSYRDRYADMIFGIQQDQQGPPEKMEGPVLDWIQKEMEAVAGPVSDLQKRRQWRDHRLAKLAKLKAEMDDADKEQ
ncbi:hypothetical protein BaRGS_00027106, partial [Batillaria attramentaria]